MEYERLLSAQTRCFCVVQSEKVLVVQMIVDRMKTEPMLTLIVEKMQPSPNCSCQVHFRQNLQRVGKGNNKSHAGNPAGAERPLQGDRAGWSVMPVSPVRAGISLRARRAERPLRGDRVVYVCHPVRISTSARAIFYSTHSVLKTSDTGTGVSITIPVGVNSPVSWSISSCTIVSPFWLRA